MGSSGGHRKLPGGSDHFSWHTDKHCIIIYISPVPQCGALQAKAIHPTLSSSTLSRQQPRQPGDHFHWIVFIEGVIFTKLTRTQKRILSLPCPKWSVSRRFTDFTISANVSSFTWRKVGSQSLMCTWEVVIHQVVLLYDVQCTLCTLCTWEGVSHLVVLMQSCFMIYLPDNTVHIA